MPPGARAHMHACRLRVHTSCAQCAGLLHAHPCAVHVHACALHPHHEVEVVQVARQQLAARPVGVHVRPRARRLARRARGQMLIVVVQLARGRQEVAAEREEADDRRGRRVGPARVEEVGGHEVRLVPQLLQRRVAEGAQPAKAKVEALVQRLKAAAACAQTAGWRRRCAAGVSRQHASGGAAAK